MPRKKQGLRSFHHKSRNGCMQCKRRRVKCTMQAPACGNCLRRNEACEYPIFGQEWSPSVEIDDTADVDAAHTTLLGSSHQDQPQTLHPLQATSNSQPMDKNTLPGDTNAILSRLFSYSWFTPQEKAVWLPALSKLANKYSYIHHCALALTSLREEPWAHRIHRTPAAAYQHQVEASSLFRQSGPTVDENNWLAVLAFGTCNLIFQFHTQNSCEEAHFDLVETLRVVRSTTDIQTAANPFFHRSELWRLILSRTGMPDAQPDLRITQSLQDLAHVVSDTADECNSDDDEATADINRQAFWELKIWAYQCGGEPRRWDQYCQWPSQVTIEYLDLLDDGNDVALLIFIYWSAIMHRSRKPFIVSWVTRAAFYAIDHLQDAWSEQLVWPIEVLTPPPLRGAALQPTSAFPPLHLSHDVEGLDSNLFADSSMDFSSASVAGFTDGDGIEPSPYLPAST